MFFCVCMFFFFFKQKTAYEMRISDWSSDVCSSDLGHLAEGGWGGVCFGHHSSLPDGVGHHTAGRGYAPDAPALDHDRVRGTTVDGWCGPRRAGPDLTADAAEVSIVVQLPQHPGDRQRGVQGTRVAVRVPPGVLPSILRKSKSKS